MTGNAELAHRGTDAFNRRDLQGLLALCRDDVEVVSRLVAIEGGYHGHDGIRRYWQNLFDAFPDLTAEIVHVQELGDVTVAEQRLRSHGARSGTPIDETIWAVTEWRDERAVWWGPRYLSEADALDAAAARNAARSRDSAASA